MSPTATTSVLSPSPPTSAISVTSHSPPALANTPALVPANPGLLIEQLQDDNLLRLWRTGANYEVYTSEEDGDVDVGGHSIYTYQYYYVNECFFRCPTSLRVLMIMH